MQFSTFVLAALSMGSAIANPAAGFPAFTKAATEVASVNVLVQQQVVAINALTSGSPKADTVAKVQKSLLTIGQSVSSLIGPVSALGGAGSNALSKEQIAALPKFQKDFQEIFVGIQAIGKRVVGSNLDKDAIAEVKPQLQWALASPVLVAQPVIAFVKVAAPKYASYNYWTPYLIDIQALIVVALGQIDLGLVLGIDISIL